MGATTGAVPRWRAIEDRVARIEDKTKSRKERKQAAINHNRGVALYTLNIPILRPDLIW